MTSATTPWFKSTVPLFSTGIDAWVIGGGISVVVGLLTLAMGWTGGAYLPVIVMLVNGAHFGASTVRLYTMPGAFERWPYVTRVLPLLMGVGIGVSLVWVSTVGVHAMALYLTWSPFHYAAQTYGLVVLYAARSGWSIEDRLRRWLYAACMMPFFLAVSRGLDFDAPYQWWLSGRLLSAHRDAALMIQHLLAAAGFVAPLLVLAYQALRHRIGPPLLCLLLVLCNAFWFAALAPRDAFFVATIFHSLQYLAVTLFVSSSGARGISAMLGRARFYVCSLVLGYALFQCMPFALEAYGAGYGEAATLMAAAINIHHFIVDAFIWRTRKQPVRVQPTQPTAVPALAPA